MDEHNYLVWKTTAFALIAFGILAPVITGNLWYGLAFFAGALVDVLID